MCICWFLIKKLFLLLGMNNKKKSEFSKLVLTEPELLNTLNSFTVSSGVTSASLVDSRASGAALYGAS
jgi:hypothetical protein